MDKKGEKLKIVVKTFFGLEEPLRDELAELGYTDATILNRAVSVSGSWHDVMLLNLRLRCAISVLVELRSFQLANADDLYGNAVKIDWTSLFDVTRTIAVKGAVNSTLFSHSQLPFLKVKDAIADVFRKETGQRPDVNVKTPHIVIDLYIREKEATISINTSGQPLFQRGYRQSTGEAPLNEVVAAGLIRLSGWDKKSPFIDPFCGSGTLLIEAALAACDIPSNIERTHYAFKNLKNFNAEEWEAIYASANKVVKSLPCAIVGNDSSPEAAMKAKRNVRGFSFGRFIDISVGDFSETAIPEEKGVLITNPPYGERLSANVVELYEGIGDFFKQKMAGYSCWIISSSEEGLKSVGLRPDRKIRLYNGDLECSFRKFTVYEGSKKAAKN